MPLERALELALRNLEEAEEAGDFVAAVFWADALDRVIVRRNRKLAEGGRRPGPGGEGPGRV